MLQKARSLLKQWGIPLAALGISLFTLFYLDDQVDIARNQMSVAENQMYIAKSEFEAKSRPYMSIEDMRVVERGEQWISIIIGVVNRGELPATGVGISEIVMGGAEVVWTNWVDEAYPVDTIGTEDNVTITTSGDFVTVIPPRGEDFPSDLIFYPNKYQHIEFPADRSTWEKTIVEGTIIDIHLTYNWGGREYWYVATGVLLPEGAWSIGLERGN